MPIITISREMGTGAYGIAQEVAKKLRYTLVDFSKISEAAEKMGIDPLLLERVDEKPPAYITAEDRLQASYLNTLGLILLEFAAKGNVILYGRGGQDLLNGLRNVLRIRFIAPFDDRVENFAEREWIDPDLAREMIRKSDHQRGGFIHFYFDRDWNDPLGYDMIFNTSHFSRSAIIESIIAAAKDPRLKQAEAEAAEVLDDIILGKKVETELLKEPCINNVHFRVEARRATISLVGHVISEEERACALRIAGEIEGVDDVFDGLQVVKYKSFK